MKPFEDARSSVLQWAPSRAGQFGFELCESDDIFARLTWDQNRRSMVSAECVTARWTFKRSGMIYPRVTVRETGSRLDSAVFTPRWRGDGALECAGGHVYHFRPADFWWTQAAFYAPHAVMLIKFDLLLKGKPNLLSSTAGRVEILPPGRACPHLPLLALLGWYLVLVRRAEAPAPGPIPIIANAPT